MTYTCNRCSDTTERSAHDHLAHQREHDRNDRAARKASLEHRCVDAVLRFLDASIPSDLLHKQAKIAVKYLKQKKG